MKIQSDKFISDNPSNKIGFFLKKAMKDDDYGAVAATELFQKESMLDVHITINGVELDVEHFLSGLYDLYDYNVRQAAKDMFEEIVNEKVVSITDELYTIEQKAKQVNNLLPWDTLWEQGYFKDKFAKKD